MKKYIFIAIIAIGSFTTSCTSDNDLFPTKGNSENQEFDYSLMQKESDTVGINEGDTGGQGGSTPIKP